MALPVGVRAPDFTLRNQHGQEIALADYAGIKDVVIVFYPFAFSSVCTGELCEIRDRLGDIQDEQTEVLAVSCDHRYSLRAYAERDGYEFSLLSDFWPHGEVSRAYDVFDERLGCSGRSTTIVDRDGIVCWTVHLEIGQARDLTEYQTVLAGLRGRHS